MPSQRDLRYAPLMPDASPILFLDTASPLVSVALGDGGQILAERTLPLRRSSEQLLAVIEEVLTHAGVERGELAGVAALQGPGSFTGLRVGLAMAQGLHQALAIPATALPTLPILAAAAADLLSEGRDHEARVTESDSDRPDRVPTEVHAAVDAIRGEWMVQAFALDPGAAPAGLPTPRSEAERVPIRELSTRAPRMLSGFGVSKLAEMPDWTSTETELIEPPPLAPVAARCLPLDAIEWRPQSLQAPIYFRRPAVTPAH